MMEDESKDKKIVIYYTQEHEKGLIAQLSLMQTVETIKDFEILKESVNKSMLEGELDIVNKTNKKYL